jgi:hypothetical protein
VKDFTCFGRREGDNLFIAGGEEVVRVQAGYVIEELVRRRAYEIYVQRGFQSGHALDDWLQAKHQLMQSSVGRTAKPDLTETMKSGHKPDVYPNITASFAWFWGGSK